MIQVTRADDLERQAAALEAEARSLAGTRDGWKKSNEAYALRKLAEKMQRGRTDGVRFG